MKKLDGLPKIYYINLDTATDRNQYMVDMFNKYNITNFQRYKAKRFRASKSKNLTPSEYGCMMSHIYVLNLIANSEDEYAIVVEDDVDISTVDVWNFTWKEFMDRLPDFDIVQLARHQYDGDIKRGSGIRTGAKLKVWDTGDVSTIAYLVKKEYAQKAVELYRKDPKGLTAFKNYSEYIGPVSDNALYYAFNSYSTCIFGFQHFDSQISDPRIVFKGFIDNIEYMQSIFKKQISLYDIFY